MARSSLAALGRVAAAAMALASIVNPARAGGAIAIGPCAAYGYAFDFRDLADAEAAALKKCAEPGCKVAVTVKRGCAAFAIDGRNACGAHGYASAARLGLAQNMALKECHSNGGRECVIRAWACDAKG